MKKSSQFLPVLKLMLGFYRYGPLPLVIYFGFTAATLFVSSVFMPIEWMNAHLRHEFWSAGLCVTSCFWWVFLMMVATPVPFQLCGGIMSLEFLFTRAVDRGLWLRTERVAVMLFGLGPLVLNLALSPLQPKLAFDPAPAGSPAAVIQARYLHTFPGSHLGSADVSGNEQLIVRHGTEMFAAWMVWSGLMCIFLVAAYWAAAFTAWQRGGWHHSKSRLRPWLGGIMVNAPVYSPVLVLLLGCSLRINPFEECFLAFAGHPVAMALLLVLLILFVQPMTERNIRKLEFEFA